MLFRYFSLQEIDLIVIKFVRTIFFFLLFFILVRFLFLFVSASSLQGKTKITRAGGSPLLLFTVSFAATY